MNSSQVFSPKNFSPTIEKLSNWENLLFTFSIFSTLLATGPIYIMSGSILIWFVCKKMWKHLPIYWDRSSKSSMKKLLNSIRQNTPTLYPIFLGSVAFAFCILLTMILSFATIDSSIPIGKQINQYIHLFFKSTVYGLILISAFMAAEKKGFLLEKSAKTLLVFMTINFVYMLFQRYTGINWVHGLSAVLPENRFDYGVYRASGFTAHPLSLGYNCMLLSLLFYGLCFKNRVSLTKEIKIVYFSLFLLSLGSLILTLSRWPLFITISLIFLSELKRIWQKRLWFIPAIVIATTFLFFQSSTLDRFKEIWRQDVSIEERIPRIIFWKVHWQMAKDYPVTGVGYPARNVRSLDYYDKAGYTSIERKYSAHNIYLQTVADSGIIGLLGLILLLTGCLLSAIKFKKLQNGNGLLIFIVASMLGGLMQNNFRDSEFIFCFWFCVSLFLTQGDKKWDHSLEGS